MNEGYSGLFGCIPTIVPFGRFSMIRKLGKDLGVKTIKLKVIILHVQCYFRYKITIKVSVSVSTIFYVINPDPKRFA